jgi:DNA-binding PadR family transcriptional regulator
MADRTSAPELTTTSYAILGLLAIKPWTTYELAQQMGRALGQFWPRAESKLYDEPKKLVARGYAKATNEAVGRRPRTVYSITPKGRRSLAAWMGEPSSGPVLEFEQLVKVFFAENGSKDDLLATIALTRQWSGERIAASRGLSTSYLRGEGPFPERLPWLVLCGQFLSELLLTVERWAEWAQTVVEAWPDDITQAEPDWATLRAQERALARRD